VRVVITIITTRGQTKWVNTSSHVTMIRMNAKGKKCIQYNQRCTVIKSDSLEILDLLVTPLPQFLLQLRINCILVRERDPSPASEILLKERLLHPTRYVVGKYGGRDTHLAIELAGSGGSAGIQRADRPVCDRICRQPSNTLYEPIPVTVTREIRVDGPWMQGDADNAFTAVSPSEFI